MKPICDYPSYCKNDASALYIGQTSHIAYKPYRSNTSYMPSGFEKVKSMWDGLCSYTANANGNNDTSSTSNGMVALSKNWREGCWKHNLYALLMGRACQYN